MLRLELLPSQRQHLPAVARPDAARVLLAQRRPGFAGMQAVRLRKTAESVVEGDRPLGAPYQQHGQQTVVEQVGDRACAGWPLAPPSGGNAYARHQPAWSNRAGCGRCLGCHMNFLCT